VIIVITTSASNGSTFFVEKGEITPVGCIFWVRTQISSDGQAEGLYNFAGGGRGSDFG
jgi:hypothetical protein